MRRFLVAIALSLGITLFGATASYALPSGYTELQYIVTNNDAYIITNLMVNDFDRVTSHMTMYDNSMGLTNGDGAVGAVLFGTTANSTAGAQAGRCFKLYVTNGNGGMTAGYDGTWGGSWSTSLAGKRVPLETPVEIDVKLASGSQWVKIDGTIYGQNSKTAGTLSNTYPVTLFALNYAGTPKGIPHLACESMVFYSGNTIVRNFVPAKRNSDNAVGLYDTVTNTFYASSSSSPFVAGPSTNAVAITYVMNGGTNYNGAPTSYELGTGATINGVPTKSANVFAGWCTDSNLTSCAMSQTIGTSETTAKTFYAKWTECQACATTNASCSLNIVNNTCTYTTACNSGYTDIQNNGAYNASCVLAGSHTITYVMNGGTNYNSAPETYLEGTGTTINGIPTKSGNVFAGWCTDSNLTSCAMTQTIGTSETGDKTFYAKWTTCPACATTNASCTPNVVNNTCVYATVCNANYGNIQNNGAYNASCSLNSYTITYVLDGGTNYNGAPTEHTYGTSVTINGTPTKSGNSFAGWCTDSELTNCAMSHTINATDTENKTFYAKWTELPSYTINYVLGYGEYTTPRPTYSGVMIPGAYTPVEFVQNTSNTRSADVAINTGFSGYGKWVIDAQGVTAPTGSYNAILMAYSPNTPVGWFGANPSGFWAAPNVLMFTTPFTTRTTIEADFSSGQQTTTIEGVTKTYTGDALTLENWRLFNYINHPLRGKIFSAKFYQNDELKFNGIPAIRNSDSVCGIYDGVTNVFRTSTTKTNLTCGDARTPDKYIAGTAKTITFVPTRANMEFLGWCTDSALTNCSMNPVIPADATGDKTFYAKWSGRTITYVGNGATVFNTASVPSDYTVVEYIQNNGYSYINTGVTGLNSGTWEIYAKWMLTQAPRVSDSWVVGTYTTNDNYNAYRISTYGQRTEIYKVTGNTKVNGGTTSSTFYPNEIHEGSIKNKSITIDGRTYTPSTTGSAITATTPIVVFARDASGNNGGFIGRMYATWAKNGGVLQYNYIPVRRNSDGVCGMWDTVSNTFKISNSSTQFTCPTTPIVTPGIYYTDTGVIISNNAPSRTGTFVGWCTDAALTDCSTSQTIPANTTENKTFYAKWLCNDGYHMDSETHECVPNTITLSFTNGGHGTAPESMTCNYGSVVTLPAEINDATGYTWRGWNVNGRWLKASTSYVCHKEVFGVTSGTANIAADWFECMDPGDGSCVDVKFTVTTTPLPANTSTTFKFSMSAKGTFYIDWGDGSAVETKSRTGVSANTYSHTYTPTGDEPVSYTIRFGGVATAYSTTETVSTISFFNGTRANRWSPVTANGTEKYIAAISGSLGALFPTIGSSNGQQPRFYQTFTGAINWTGPIPDGLFTGISGTPATYMFNNTFSECPNLTGPIPANLFNGLTGAPAKELFYRTFNNSGVTGSIPENLFTAVGTPAENLFGGTFGNCSGLTGSIPAGLFSRISGAPANRTFDATFSGCTGLTGSIPENLFAGIKGAPNTYTFNNTFGGCSGLTGSIPGSLFSGLSGAPNQYMFNGTFNGCTNLSGYIEPNMFDNIRGAAATNMMTNIFNNTGLDTTCPVGTEQYITGFESYWSSKVACGPEIDTNNLGNEKFTVTVDMPANTAFKFHMSAIGDFYVDWGDGTGESIGRAGTSELQYSHTYTNAGTYQIKFYGIATGYSTANVAAIRFFNGTRANHYSAITATGTEQYITGISGSLGALFPTINTGEVNGQQPRFYQTFTGATNLTGTLPANLFSGITGRPATYMFDSTFAYCTSLTTAIPATLFGGLSGAPSADMFYYTFANSGFTGSIPATLFSGISGAPAGVMFGGTFIGCSGLTGEIPATLFSGISGAPATYMFASTFSGCSGLSGSIPATLFSGISGAPATYMFSNTFNGCSGLTGSIPATLFSGVSGAPAQYMFTDTFNGCSGLTGPIPATLFAGITTPSNATAVDQFSGMYRRTFKNCSGLTGSIPGGLLRGWGPKSDYMFQETFYGCSGLSGYIPYDLMNLLNNPASNSIQPGYVYFHQANQTDMYTDMFTGTTLAQTCPAGTLKYTTGIESQISPYVMCVDLVALYGNEPKFTITTTEMAANTAFSFSLYHTGTIFVDWGDGTATRYNRGTLNTTAMTASHTYTTAGSYQIKFYGVATGYHATKTYPTISFKNNANIAGISGSLGALFPTLGTTAATIPNFYQTFYGCTNLQGPIPATLFGDVPSKTVRENQFYQTFYGCTGFTDTYIPPTLFAGRTSTASNSMYQIFEGSTLLTECPSGTAQYVTGLESAWSSKVACTPAEDFSNLGDPKFTITTTNLDTDTTFKFKLSAAGTFYVDWGDGNTQIIADSSVSAREYTHTYATAGSYQIKFWGTATAYSTTETVPAISFFNGTRSSQNSNITAAGTEQYIAGISGSLGALFPTLGASNGQQPRFYNTFAGATNLTGAIPAGLFNGITGRPSTHMFDNTFFSTGLTTIPTGLFDGLTGAPSAYMFYRTFANSTGLTSIPSGLFANITGAPATYMFAATFGSCSGLTGTIPEDLFENISGTPAAYMFDSTFGSCSGLSGGIPADLFEGISGAPAEGMFQSTFSSCSGLSGSIPANLFRGISGAPAYYMFSGTFAGCTSLTGTIPGSLFSGISGALVVQAFALTFNGCSGLSGYVPPELFANVTGQHSDHWVRMFQDSGLLTACPTGTSQYTTGFESYWNSKVSCTDGFITPFVLDNSDATTASVPTTIYAKFGIDWYSDANATTKFTQLATLPTKPGKIFNGYWTTASGTGTQVIDATGTIISNSTTTKLAKISDESVTLYPRWSDTYAVTYSCGDGTGTAPDAMVAVAGQTFTPAANTCSRDGYFLEGWSISDTSTVNNGTSFTWDYTTNKTFTASYTPAKFIVTTTDMAANTTFNFTMSAKGTFRVDWGDGTPIETITRSSTSSYDTYSHTYTTGGVKTIMFDGLATGYRGSTSYRSYQYAAIAFYNNKNIARVSGSLGSIFPSRSTSISSSEQPQFAETFYGCSNLTEIPSTLFSGVTTPYTAMFFSTFADCTSLTSIPSGLFASIEGNPQPHMFRQTFKGCSGITSSIPSDLFGGIYGQPATYMFSQTFSGCSGITGTLPSGLFSRISGTPAEAMYDVTFGGCSGFTGPIPSGFFGNISGSAANYMYTGVFIGCSGLTGPLPENLFGNISGSSTEEFRQAFYGCTNLSGYIPPRMFTQNGGSANLFMDQIFMNSGLLTECPTGTTQYITGFESYWSSKVSCTDGFVTPITLNDSSATTAAAPSMVYLKYGFGWYADDTATNSLTQLTTLPTKTDWIFDGYYTASNGGGTQVIDATGAPITTEAATKMAKITDTGKTVYANWVKNYDVTYSCGDGTGTAPAAAVATTGKTFTPAANTCSREGYMFTGWNVSGTSTSISAPFTWNYSENKTLTAQWAEGPKFTITTTNMADNTTFNVAIGAGGTFYIDWGDGTIQTITRSASNTTTYSHTYVTGGVRTINMAGLATAYYSSSYSYDSRATIHFMNNTNIARVSGSLGAIFPTLSGTSSYSTNPRFMYTFSGCSNLTEIPATLFNGVTRPYLYIFYNTFNGCTSLTSIPETLFSGISGAPAESMFQNTFANTGLTSIPATLFSTIQGTPAASMFRETFSGCTGLQSLPSGLFSGISGTPANYMYYQTFYGCTGLTGSIPNRFFGNLSGTLSSGNNYFYETFGDCSNLSGYVPTDLFTGLSYANSSSTNNIFNGVFSGTNLATSCPTGMQQYYTGFENYFDGKVACTTAKTPNEMGDIKFTITTTNMGAGSEFPISISAAGEFLIDCGNTINGEPQYIYIADGRTTRRTYTCEYPSAGSYQIDFYGLATVYDSSNNNLPAINFRYPVGYPEKIAGISGSLGALFPTIGNGNSASQQPRFNSTFEGAINMTGTIPENLFDGITGTPATYMFSNTFAGCSKLTGTIPENLFGGLTGSVNKSNGYYFYRTFNGCSGLTGYVPANLFRMSTSYMSSYNNMGEIFNGSGLLDKCPAGTMQYYTGFEGNWYLDNNNNKQAVSCEPGISDDDVMFKIYTTELDDGDTFSFSLSAAGTFYVDWGDDTVDKIERNNTTPSTYSHTYEIDKGGISFQIKFINDGVTAYSSDIITPAISFAGNTKVAEIWGSLGELMPTITVGGKAQQPRFYQTFKDCTNLESMPGESESSLFGRITNNNHPNNPAITGQPVSHMFEGLFQGCTGLDGYIPSNLFINISGTPTIGLFAHTFEGCSGLYDGIPEDLFAGISGAPAISMFEATFKGCSGLKYEIPEDLFAGISGAPAERMFYETFDGCENLEGYIYPNTFAGISRVNVANMMTDIFDDSGLDTECPNGTTQYITGFEDWFDGKVSCDDGSENADMNYNVFYVNLNNVESGATFSFDLSATGEFRVDWGDGNTDYITRTDTTPTTYSHTYTNTNSAWYSVNFSSAVTGYSTNETTPAISFEHASNTSGIEHITTSGSLMEMFPVLGTANGQIPRFYHTFYGLTNLYGFNNGIFNPNYNSNENDPQITNLPFASHMFDGMFANCTNLFDNDWWGNNEDTENFRDMFYAFGGTPAAYTFANMFSGTTNATGYISPYMFNNITGTATNMMQNIFANSGLDTECPEYMVQYTTGFESNWSGKVSCAYYDIEVELRKVTAGATFSFDLSAIGTFTINWGDGSTLETITRTNTTPTTYSHTYSESGDYYVDIDADNVTGYSTSETTAAISFAHASNISGIDAMAVRGSLMEMFPVLGTANGQIPRFYHTFYGLTNLYGFNNGIFNPNYNSNENDPQITNLPFASHMFDGMFANCTNLFDNDWWGNNETSENFDYLFYAFGGTPAPYTFANMFSGTTNATGYISPYMFNNITGTATNMMQNIFANSGLDTECPSNYIQYITGFESDWSGKVSCEYGDNILDNLPYIDIQTTYMSSTSTFEFSMSATGTFYVDWGDGSAIETINRTNTTPTTYSHEYSGGNAYNIKIYGRATGYSTNETTAAISFANNDFVNRVGAYNQAPFGSVFPTIGDGTTNGQQPRFYRTFYNCENLYWFYGNFTTALNETCCDNNGNNYYTPIYGAGIHGAPASHMFDGLFENCENLGTPSQDIFAYTENDYSGNSSPTYGISGAPAPYVFANTFKNTGIGSLYQQWFRGLSGAPAAHMFDGTFEGVNNIYIDFSNSNNTDMFKNIVGAPAAYMFANTFKNAYYVGGTPNGLFSGIRGVPAEGMFAGTFENTDISAIPEDLFAGVIGAPAAHMFENTFAVCDNLSGDYLSPALFINISGAAAPYMFAGTFAGANISGNLPTMFAGITGSAAHMFEETFANTPNFVGYIQPQMFAGITGTATDMMTDIFAGSSLLTECPDGTTQYTTGFESWWDDHVACIQDADSFDSRAYMFTTSMPANTTFSFMISAKGTFYVDWGDGSEIETITRNNTTPTTYSHTYIESNEFGWGIRFGGVATGYSTNETTAAISFANNPYVKRPETIGHLFPTLGTGNGYQPRFYQTFKNCTNMVGDITEILSTCYTDETDGGEGSSISDQKGGGNINLKSATISKRASTTRGAIAHGTSVNTRSASIKRKTTSNSQYNHSDYDACIGMFDGIYGQPVSHMFDGTFEGCTGLTGQLPGNLFITISGTPVPYVFANTFKNCTGISGEIPRTLFAGIYGTPAAHMFESTFENDLGLTGSIPEALFGVRTSKSSSVSGISGGDTGPIKSDSSQKSATILKREASLTRGAVRSTGVTSNLRRESETPSETPTITLSNDTFSGINGAPAAYMFSKTFKGCTNLSGDIPAGLFSGINGAPAEYMFEETFAGCTGLETIPSCLFGGISGTPAAGMYLGTFDGCSNIEWEYIFENSETSNNSVSSGPIYVDEPQLAASNIKRSATTRGAVSGISNNTKATLPKANSLREAVLGGLTRGGLRRSAGLLRSNTTTTTNANAMPSLFGHFTGAAAANMFKNTFRGCTNLNGYVPPKMFDGITGTANDMMTDEFENSGIATTCPAGYATATTGFESWWDGRVACEYVGQICVYDESANNPYKCADGCAWAGKLMMYDESWEEFGGFPGYPLLSESVTDHAINISNGTTTCYLPITENSDWGLHIKWNDTIWHAMFAQSDAENTDNWGYCDGTYNNQNTHDGTCTTNSDCTWLYDATDNSLTPACWHGTCALYQSYDGCYYVMGDKSQCQWENSE